jgi:hypothetical protein
VTTPEREVIVPDDTPAPLRIATRPKRLRPKYPEEWETTLGPILSRADLGKLPKPQPLIEGWLDLRTAVVVVGDTGTNKTFAALGWCCSVATGQPWLDHAVAIDPSPVILVVGEGAFGLHARISAWEQRHNNGKRIPDSKMYILRQPPAGLADQQSEFWEHLTDLTQRAKARLVVLDTFSSLAPGADETDDAAQVIRRMSELAVATDGTVVLTHHTGWGDKTRSRGGSQLESDPDGVILLQKSDANDPQTKVTITRKKDKDGPAGGHICVQRVPVADSCVLELTEQPEGKASGGRFASHADIKSLICQYVRDNPDEKESVIVAHVATVHRVGDKRVKAAFKELGKEKLLVSKSVKLMEGSRMQPRDVWSMGNARVRAAPRLAEPDTA